MDEIKKRISLSDALIIAAIPVVAYFLQYVYYIGYFSVFKLPRQFIILDIKEVFIVISGLTGFSIVFWLLVNFFSFFIL